MPRDKGDPHSILICSWEKPSLDQSSHFLRHPGRPHTVQHCEKFFCDPLQTHSWREIRLFYKRPKTTDFLLDCLQFFLLEWNKHLDWKEVFVKYLLLFCFVIFSNWADARPGEGRRGKDSQRYVIDINDYRGRTYAWTELNIKDLLRNYYSVRLSKARLTRVEIDADSMQGRTSVDLLIGNTIADSGNLRRRSRDGLTLYNDNGERGKRWLLDIMGSLHIRQIAVYLKQGHYGKKKGAHRRGHHRRNKTISLGEQKIEKSILNLFFSGKTVYTFHANGSRSRGIRIFCTKRKVRVNGVTLEMRNGRRQQIHGLDGTYRAGESEEIFFSTKNVESVIIEATSPGIDGSRGILGVELYSP